MAEAEKTPEGVEEGQSAEPEETGGKQTTEVVKEKSGWKSTLISAMTVLAVLVLIYLALTYLMGSDFNLDTLLTGEKMTRLP